MAILNGKALAEARRKKGWTQKELSEATKINVSTISRIERGKQTHVHANTLRQFMKALDVPRETLCPIAEAARDVMKLPINHAARNALTLVALRYGVSRKHIVEIAPLLFFIAAEQSLQERQKRLAELRDAGDALFCLRYRIPHLPLLWTIDEDALVCEEQSIRARDLFGEKVLEYRCGYSNHDYDDAKDNPLVMFLQDSLAKASNSPEAAESVRWKPGLWPTYKICTEEAASIVGNDEEAKQAIFCGDAALHEMPKGSPEERAEWARADHHKDRDIEDAVADWADSLKEQSLAQSLSSNSGEGS